MVILGKRREGEAEEKLLEMGPERSKPLHNFSMPCLKWGNQRLLRCMKMNPNGAGAVPFAAAVPDRRSPASDVEKCSIARRREPEDERRGGRVERKESFKKSPSPAADFGVSERKSKGGSDGDEEIEAVREKLLLDFQAAAEKMKVSIFRKGTEEEPPSDAEGVRPWNLRKRRAACKLPNGMNGAIGAGATVDGGGAKSMMVDERRPNFSSSRTEKNCPRLHGDVATAVDASTGHKGERSKLSIALSRREIEEDFMAMTGHRPHRRPKKRAKIVQKQLDSLFPGLWLTEVTADLYKVPDAFETGKR